MLGLSATYNYFLSYGSVDMRKGCFSLSQLVREEMGENPLDGNNVYIFLAKNLKVVKILHYERGFFVLYEKRPLQELTRERDRNANNNRKNYSRTSEQARLLNNREADKRSLEKQEFAGASSAKPHLTVTITKG